MVNMPVMENCNKGKQWDSASLRLKVLKPTDIKPSVCRGFSTKPEIS
mgnify:FL=1